MSWLAVAIVLLPLAIYIAPIQDAVIGYVVGRVNSSGGMIVSYDRLRLRWPLRLEAENVDVLTAPADTMAHVGRMDVDMEALPLLALRACVHASVDDARFKMGHPDSAMWLLAVVRRLDLQPSTYHLASSEFDISEACLDGADVRLAINPSDPSDETADTATTSPALKIMAGRLMLKDIDFAMTMLPVIDSLGVCIAKAELDNGIVDLARQMVDARRLSVDSVTAAYLVPDGVAPKDSVPSDTTAASMPWTITAGGLSLSAKEAVYGVRGHEPQPGLDMEWLQVGGVEIRVDSFYNRGPVISVPIKRLSATERCGLHIDASGLFAMDSTVMRADSMRIDTYFSSLAFDARMGIGDLASDGSLPLMLCAKARIGFKDISAAMPSLRPIVGQLPQYRDIEVEADLDGTVNDFDVRRLSVTLPNCVALSLDGNIAGLPSVENLDGDVALRGRIYDTPLLKSRLVSGMLGPSVALPPMTLGGDIVMRRGGVSGNMKAVTAAGQLALDASWSGRLPSYVIDLKATEFPVDAFLPTSGVGRVTATAGVSGRGLDVASPRTHVQANIGIESVSLNNRLLRDIYVRASLDSCRMMADVASSNPDADMNLTLNARLDSAVWRASVGGNVRNLDMKALGLSETKLGGSLTMAGDVAMNPAAQYYVGRLDVGSLAWNVGELKLATSGMSLSVDATDSLIKAGLTDGDFSAGVSAYCGLDGLIAGIDSTMSILQSGLAERRIGFDSLQRAMPRFDMRMSGGQNSMVANVLKQSDIEFKKLSVAIANDSAIHALAYLNGMQLQRQRIDSIALTLRQEADSMRISGGMFNRPGTFDKFATVRAEGELLPSEMSIMLDQQDIQGNTGYRLGLGLLARDSLLRVRLLPDRPIINYREWSLNADNYINYDGRTNLIDADLRLSNGPSYLHLLTNRLAPDSTGVAEELQILADKIHLADWISVSPFAPPVNGDLGSDIRVRYNPQAHTVAGHGTVRLADLSYGKSRVGTFDLGLDLATTVEKVVNAAITMDVDSTRVLTARGALNDSAAATPMSLNIDLTRFPLALANPFLPKGVATLQGWLSGDMKASGTMASPRLDGYLNFDSAAVNAGMIGTRFDLSSSPIRVDSSVVRFEGFSILGANNNPLDVNGTVDANSFANPRLDLKLSAKNMQVLKSDRKRGQDAYGRAFIDLDATVRGNMQMLDVNASLSLLSGSNLTYVLGGGTTGLPSMVGASDAVRFVQFSDSTAVLEADTIANTGMALMLNAKLNINEGTTINVDLSATNAQDRAQIVGAGSLTFTMSPFADMRLTGRYNINSGFVRYSPPLMSQKNFKFVRGSYVAFNGDILNPTLNIQAIDQIRANVTEAGQNSRLVNFDVILNVTQTLENMNVVFDLTTDDDMTVKNELQSMSADQRANQAMNMLLYNVYTGPGTRGSANMSGNPLFSFLASTVNAWAANNIKGVELTFGVDQYDKTFNGSTSTATSYNYQVSKSFVNDRLKIVVGGNYTDDDASTTTQDYKQNLINDISFEYMLNQSGTMYVRLFRHTGFESILEGEVTQTGLGFVYRRKLGTLYSLLPRFMRPRRWRRPDKPLSTEQIIQNASNVTPPVDENENATTESK